MLKTHEAFRLVDESKQNELKLEVNWNPKEEKSNECKLIRFTFPNGETSTIKREHLFSILFACGTDDQQRKSIPQRITKSRSYQTVLGIKATKNIKAGEMINVPVNIPLPDIVEDIIGDIKGTANRYA